MPFETREQNGLVFLTSPLLSGVRHAFSTRKGGVSVPPWDRSEEHTSELQSQR